MTDRVWKRYVRAYNDDGVENAAACLAADWSLSDHRATGMWDAVQGRDAWARQLRRVWISADGHDTRLELHEVIAQVATGRAQRDGAQDGEWAIPRVLRPCRLRFVGSRAASPPPTR